ncbi:MAG: proliferating cell nuclear antigen (pcna) [Candidatus Micrarchaeota archaeon]|nr:proliferating cell nuclear antigen (pcna) [Candidatus Micrarchaeota archaeon]
MFKFTVGDAKRYKNATDAIVNLIDEGILEVREEGLFLRAMDPSQIAMISFLMPKASFAEYEAPAPSAKIGLNFDGLSKILARSRGEEKLEISQVQNKLQLKFVGKSGKRSFKVPVLDIPAGVAKEPSIAHDAIVKMNSSQFKETLRDASLVGSHITLDANETAFTVEVHGDTSDLTEENEKTGERIIEMTVTKPSRATFPLQYLEDIVKACPENAALTICLKSNAPLKVEYEVESAKVTYYLAPRIDND